MLNRASTYWPIVTQKCGLTSNNNNNYQLALLAMLGGMGKNGKGKKCRMHFFEILFDRSSRGRGIDCSEISVRLVCVNADECAVHAGQAKEEKL